MLKILLLSILIFYIFMKVGGLVLRTLFGSLGSDRNQHQFTNAGQRPTKRHRPRDGNLNVDSMPDNKSKRKGKDYQGGEYVDYEEVD